MIATRFTHLAPPTIQASSRRTQTLCPQVAEVNSQREGQTSHSRPPASEVAVRMTAPPHHLHVDALAWFVSPLLAGYFPL
jgi:hypothetical protein